MLCGKRWGGAGARLRWSLRQRAAGAGGTDGLALLPESVPSSEGPAAFLSPAPASRTELSLNSPVGPVETKNRQEKAFVSSAELQGQFTGAGLAWMGRDRRRWQAVVCLTLCIPPIDALLRRYRLHRLVPGAG